MAKIKVVLNKPEPSRETINKYKYQHKSNLVKDYQKLHTIQGIRHVLYKDKLLLSLIIVLVIAMLFLLFAVD